jgi:hypothetical protein
LLSTEQVCLILEASAKSGVAELKFGGLHVKFATKADAAQGHAQLDAETAPVKVLTEDQHTKQTADVIEHDQIRLREEELANALVEDPMRFENMLRSGELNDDALDSANDGDDE